MHEEPDEKRAARRRQRRRRQSARMALSAALIGVVVVRELRKPAEQRTWVGKLGFLPYDLRRPTLQRARSRWWNPEDPHLVVPRVFGVGWTLNLAQVAHRAETLSHSLHHEERELTSAH